MTIVNLNKFRKAKARANKQTQANENAVKFGRTKSQKQLESAQVDKARQELDGKERE
jgi:hypothetical protein